MLYCTVSDIKEYLMDSGTEHDTRYRSAIEHVSGVIDSCVSPRRFLPHWRTVSVDCGNTTVVRVLDSLLTPTAAREDGTQVSPTRRDSRTLTFLNKEGDITITGIFGYCVLLQRGLSVVDSRGNVSFDFDPTEDTYYVAGKDIILYTYNNFAQLQNGATVAAQDGDIVYEAVLDYGIRSLAVQAAIRMLQVPNSQMSRNLSPNQTFTSDWFRFLAEYRPDFV